MCSSRLAAARRWPWRPGPSAGIPCAWSASARTRWRSSYDSVRWVYCAGIKPDGSLPGVYPQTLDALGRLRAALAQAGSSFPRVVRTWFYLGGITEPETDGPTLSGTEPRPVGFLPRHPLPLRLAVPRPACGLYPASTGIGMAGRGLVAELPGAGNPAGRRLPAAAGESPANSGLRL